MEQEFLLQTPKLQLVRECSNAAARHGWVALPYQVYQNLGSSRSERDYMPSQMTYSFSNLACVISESSQVEDALRVAVRLEIREIQMSIEKILSQPSEISWLSKPTEIALFLSLYKKTGLVDERMLERFFFTAHDTNFLFNILMANGFPELIETNNCEFSRNEEPTVFFFSTKFGDYVSSQEYFFSVLELIAPSINVVLLSERSFSERYRRNFRCISYSGASQLKVALRAFRGGLVVDLSGGHRELILGLPPEFSVVDPHGVPRLNANYLRSQLATQSLSKYRRFLVNPVDSSSDPLMFLPGESSLRSYPKIRSGELRYKKLVFGAFCRTAKLNLPVVREWARVLRRHRDAELWFAFIQSNPLSEAVVKRIFEGLGVEPERVRFIPRLDTNR